MSISNSNSLGWSYDYTIFAVIRLRFQVSVRLTANAEYAEKNSNGNIILNKSSANSAVVRKNPFFAKTSVASI